MVSVALFALLFAGLWLGLDRAPGTYQQIVAIVSDPAAEALTRGLDRLYSARPDLARRVDVSIRAPSNTATASNWPADHDLLLVDLLESTWVKSNAERLEARQGGAGPAVAFGAYGRGLTPASLDTLGLARSEVVDAYWANRSPAQIEQMWRYLLLRYLGHSDLKTTPPEPVLDRGFMVMRDNGIKLVPDWPAWTAASEPDESRPRVAVLAYASPTRARSIAVPRAIIEELRAGGLQPVPVFASKAVPAIRELLIDEQGQARVDAVISLHMKFAEAGTQKVLAALDVPVINAITVYGRTVDEWRASKQGLTPTEVAWQLAVPELSGLAPPNVVGGVDNAGSELADQPIDERIARVVDRAAALVRLQKTPPGERRVAMLYWNYPPGKQNIGASYLNVLQSFPEMLRALSKAGYDLGGADVSSPKAVEDLQQRIRQRGLNIGKFSPGELKRLLKAGDIVRVPIETYRRWFTQLPPKFQEEVTHHWGPPKAAEIMATGNGDDKSLILPLLRLGNIVLMPQPDRARTQDLEALFHSQDLPPHHQYIAAYLWLQRVFDAHALIHTGTHGTHEWLAGKEAGLSGADAGEVLAGDLPILYPYIVDDVGEGTVAKRRGAATIIDHLTPALGSGGLSPPMARLRDLLDQWQRTRSLNPEAAGRVTEKIDAAVIEQGIDKDLAGHGWSAAARAEAPSPDARFEALEHHIEEVREATIPLGLHTYGISPKGERLARSVQAIVEANGKGIRAQARRRLKTSGDSEIDSLLHGLAGGYIRPGIGNDPVRAPQAIPTGKNFASFDPRTIPSPATIRLGQDLAGDLVGDYKAKHGRYPDKLAFQLWGVETIRNQGAQEAQALALLGVRPVRDERGRITDLERIPRAKLGRPRVDVVLHATSLYRDTFPVLIKLLSRAVKLAAQSPEPDNPIAKHTQSLQSKLVAGGMDSRRARRRSLVRVFAEPSGRHDSKLRALMTASSSWDDAKQVGETYIDRMGHGYGQGIWGKKMDAAFRDALSGTEAIVHSDSSNLYGTLDNDDFYSYGGSIALGVRTVDGGASPPFLVTELSNPSNAHHEPIERVMGRELRARYLNPEYAQQMMREGYAGGRNVWKATEFLWGWQVMYPEAVDAAKWRQMYEVWVNDRYQLGLKAFFDKHNPYARQGIAGRMLETVRKGYWSPKERVVEDLARVYVEEIAEHGVACDHLSCNNPELQQLAERKARAAGVAEGTLKRWREAVETATGQSIEAAAAARIAERNQLHNPQPKPQSATTQSQEEKPSAAKTVRGYKMKKVAEQKLEQTKPQPPAHETRYLAWLLIAVLLLCTLSGAVGRATTLTASAA